MASTLPLPGIYFRKGHFDDRLMDGLVTVRISVAIITPLGVEERELEFTGADILSAVQNMLAALGAVSVFSALPMSSALGGDLPTARQQRALAQQVDADTAL